MTFASSPDWKHDLEEFVLDFKQRERKHQSEIEQKHIQHAQAFGRNPYAARPGVVDSGTPVFGSKGLEDVSLILVDGQLVGAGLRRTGGYVQDKSREGKLVLVLNYSNYGKPTGGLSLRAEGFLKSLLRATWGHLHVWANPPSLDEGQRFGKIMHTINAGWYKPDEVPIGALDYYEGRWWLTDIGRQRW